ncbi:DUF418 domain-containing protein [Streptomyces gamaensis]|uniref:DUF418 domain-containing protein n=1 Tax=Streptomyces gamaensis TaxID=1763542 RepID=A0ABW0YV72_9ACTN
MTHSTPPAGRAPALTLPARTSAAPAAGRLVGVDLARGLAVLGMYAAHVGPDPSDGGPAGLVMEFAHGRASALFALLAGFSLVLMTGRLRPRTGRAGRQAVARVLVRAVVLFALGTVLTMAHTDVDVILAFYALYFVCALPLYRLRARTLALLAAGSAVVLPQVLYVVQGSIAGSDWADAVTGHDPLARLGGTGGVLGLLFTGAYPVLTWIPFVLAGMAVARLDVASAAVRRRLAGAGCALVVLGHGGSWLALHLWPAVPAAIDASNGGTGAGLCAWWSDVAGFPAWDTPAWLLAASPHSETTLSVAGNTGVALVVLAGCLALTERAPLLRKSAEPVTAVGRMSLTAYVLNVVGIWALGIEDVPGSPLPVLFGFVAVVVLFALLWSRVFRRGPLEYLLYRATGLARLVP